MVIKLHKLKGTEIVINAELIEAVESVPDTKIILVTGNQFIVKENIDYVINKIKEYQQEVHQRKQERQEKIVSKK